MVDTDTSRLHTGQAAFFKILSSFRRRFRFLGNLTVVGAVGAIIGSLIQFSSWRDEKNLTRYREELANAIGSYSEIVGALSGMKNLQDILFFTYTNASGYFGSIDENRAVYLRKNATSIHGDYSNARITLRKNIDWYVGRADLFMDRPLLSDEDRDKEATVFVTSDRDFLRASGFDCQMHMPDPARKISLGAIAIDWRNVSDHVRTFYYCSEEFHNALILVREWASAGNATAKRLPDKIQTDLEKASKLQTKRLEFLISVSHSHIERMRLRDRPSGFFQHQFGLFGGT